MNADENESKSSMSKQASVTLEEKGKEVVAEVETTKEVTTAQPVEARDKAKDAPNTGPELFPETVLLCVAKLTAPPVGARDKVKDAPTTGPELFPEAVPPCVAKLTAPPVEARDKAKDAPNTGSELFPEAVPLCVAKLTAPPVGARDKVKDAPTTGPELFPESVPPCVAKLTAPPVETRDKAKDAPNTGPELFPESVPACVAKLTAQPLEAPDKAKDASSTGPELFPESVPACVAKLTAQPLEAPDKAKDAPSTGPELFPESVPSCVAELGSATALKAPGASNPKIIPMTTVASATKYERKLNANHHVAKIKASRKGGVLKMAPPDEDGPELLPEAVKNPPFISKLVSEKSYGNGEDMVNAKAGSAGTKVLFDMDKSKPNKNIDVTKRARTTHAAALKTKHGIDVPQGMPFRIQEDDGSPPLTVTTSVANLSSNQTGDHQCAGAAVKRQAMAEQNRRFRERRKMRHQDASSNNEEDLNGEGLPLSFPPRVGDNEGTNIAPPTLFFDQYDEMKVEEEEILNQLDKDESQQPGAFAVDGIGADDPLYAWQSMLEIPESQDSTENNQNTNNNQAHLSNEDMISMPDQKVSDGSENLISAIVVDDDAIPQAEAVSEEVLQRNKRKRTLCCLVGLALLMVTIVLAVVLSRGGTTVSQAPSQSIVPSTSPSELPSQNPTSIPSTSPSMSPTSSVQLFLEQVSPVSIEAFEDETSPQSKALKWLEYNHTNLLNTYNEDRIIQRFVLATLYYSTKGDQWIQSNGWLDSTQHECRWFSSPCLHDNTYWVIKLPSNRLKGFLPREIYLLSNLRDMDVSDNVLSESLPTELGLLKNIKTINLNGNSFEGSVPTEVGDLNATLTQLDLSSNNIEGKIPSAVGLLTGLESLKFGDNILSGTMISEIGMLSNLKTLSMMGNNLDGTVPTQLVSLERLEVLDLSNNLLSGTLPLTMNQTSTQSLVPSLLILKELRAQSNFITGTLPSILGLISDLELLNMNSNRMEGSIPSEMGQLVQLETLDLSGNTDISGILPTELGLLKRLESMQISQTRISGSIGTEIAGMENLKSLDLSRNELRSTIPETITSLVNLEYLDLSRNELTGPIPETKGSLVNLEYLDLSRNELTGPIPETKGSLVNLEYLDLYNNKLTGPIPETMRSLVNLEYLDLYNNKLTGPIPETMRSLVNLEYLDLYNNELSGTIPETLGSLVNLETLWLSSNELSGTIPETLGSLVNLESLSLVLNKLTGTIPETLGSLVNLESLNLYFNELSGTIPETMGSLLNLESLSLVFNKLTGTIPETLGSLVNLDEFYIYQNDLTGEVPNKLCVVKRTNNIENFLIDCNEISCDCCFDYCPNPPRILNSTSSSTANCSDGTTLLQVATGTDRDPEGVEWDVVDESTNETLLQGVPLTQDDLLNTILQETCVPNDACLLFTIRGSNGDGYDTNFYDNTGDRFMVHLNGSEVSNGRLEDFQKEEGFFVGETSSCVAIDRQKACSVTHRTCKSIGLECDLDNDGGLSGFCVPDEPSVSPSISPAPSLSPSSSPAPSLSPAPSSSPSQLPTASPSTSPAPSYSPSQLPTASPSTSPAPSLSPSSNPIYTPCDNGLSNIVIELTTDKYPEETSWKLVNDDTGDVILQDGNYADPLQNFVSQTCTSNDACLRFTINDSYRNGLFEGGGYVIYVNNEQVASGGGDFGLSETKVIGSCPETAFPNVSPSTSSSVPTASPTIRTEFPSLNPTVIMEDNNESLSPPCQDSMVNFTVEITIENDPERVAWTVENTNSGSNSDGNGSSNDANALLQGGPYEDNGVMGVDKEGTAAITVATTVTESICVVSNACLLFKIQDAEAVPSELSFGSTSLDSLLATVNLYADGSKVAIATFWGPTIITEVGACSPIQ